MVSTASPDDDGTRNDRIVWKTSMTLMKSTSPNPASMPLERVQDGVGDLARVHDHDDAAGDTDDQRHPEQVARAVDEGVDEGVLVHLRRGIELRHEEGDDRHAEETPTSAPSTSRAITP